LGKVASIDILNRYKQPDKMDKQCIKALVSGRVQGVFFRQSTRQQAIKLGISGQAINLPDGRVEVIACGTQENIQHLLAWLQHGPEMAQVSNVEYKTIDIEIPHSFTTG
jgi:acylphosphatase